MRFTIANPDKEILDMEVKLIQLPGLDGSFEILENHAPLLSILAQGRVRMIDMEGQEHTLDVVGGFLGLADNQCHLLLV